MSVIHETLYQNTDVSRIGFPSYITRIAGNIIQSYRSETQVELVTELEDIEAPLDQAIPCGLILNEWVSNAMKYAFVGRKTGHHYGEAWGCKTCPMLKQKRRCPSR